MKAPVFLIKLSRMGDALKSLALLLLPPGWLSCFYEKLFELLPLFLLVCMRKGDWLSAGLYYCSTILIDFTNNYCSLLYGSDLI